MKVSALLFVAVAVALAALASAGYVSTAEGLLVGSVVFEHIDKEDGKDFFEIETLHCPQGQECCGHKALRSACARFDS